MSCRLMCIMSGKITAGLPFLCLFIVGYLYFQLTTWFGHAFSGSRELAETLADLAVPAPVDGEMKNFRVRRGPAALTSSPNYPGKAGHDKNVRQP
jgi:hypothetical protein